MAIDSIDKKGKFIALGKLFNHWDHGYDFPRRFKQVFNDIEIKDKNILEIGCGSGLLSIWAALFGANRVVGLEPLEQGSGSFEETKIFHEFNSFVTRLGLANISLIPKRLQDYRVLDDKFDVVLSVASVNHLDEENCIALRESRSSRRIYLDIFKDILQKMNVGGKIILIDCSSRNFFGDIGVTNPMAKTIEWNKHQTPKIWIDLLLECGFSNPKISWLSGRYLRYVGVNSYYKFISYFLDSMFRIEMTYVGESAEV